MKMYGILLSLHVYTLSIASYDYKLWMDVKYARRRILYSYACKCTQLVRVLHCVCVGGGGGGGGHVSIGCKYRLVTIIVTTVGVKHGGLGYYGMSVTME